MGNPGIASFDPVDLPTMKTILSKWYAPFLNGKIHPLDFQYPFTNYRKSIYTNPIVEGPFNGSPSSSKKLGEHCTFEQPPTIKQSTQLAFNTCESIEPATD
jgi:hypothetical protein